MKRPVFWCRCGHVYLAHVNDAEGCRDCRCHRFVPDRENYPVSQLWVTS